MRKFILALQEVFEELDHELTEFNLDFSRIARFDTWVGTDADGNPNVEPRHILTASVLNAIATLEIYHAKLGELREIVSFSSLSLDPDLNRIFSKSCEFCLKPLVNFFY